MFLTFKSKFLIIFQAKACRFTLCFTTMILVLVGCSTNMASQSSVPVAMPTSATSTNSGGVESHNATGKDAGDAGYSQEQTPIPMATNVTDQEQKLASDQTPPPVTDAMAASQPSLQPRQTDSAVSTTESKAEPSAASMSEFNAVSKSDLNAKPTSGTETVPQTEPKSQPGESAAPQPSPGVEAPSTKPVPAATTAVPQTTVQITIVGDKAKGIILEAAAVEVREGDMVIDILKRITREKKIQMEFRGIGKNAYVEGISNLYEFDKGASSGWLFSVNGTFSSTSAGSYRVNKGDSIRWMYTLDMGKDVGKDGATNSEGKAQ